MHNEKAEDFISMAEEDKLVMEESRHFGFRTANSACFHAQQYAEKMIKARLIIMGFQIVRTHNLIFLLEDFGNSPRIEKAREYCQVLNRYEARTRYPVEGKMDCSPEEAEEACEMALEIPYLIGLYEEERADRQMKSASRKRGLRGLFKKR